MEFDWRDVYLWLSLSAAGFVGRCLHYLGIARDGKFTWSWGLVFDSLISITMGLVGGALAEWLEAPAAGTYAIAGACGHLGAQGVKGLFEAVFRAR